MVLNFQFDPNMIDSLIGGLSALEINKLNIQSLDQAKKFIAAYGYDLDSEKHSKKLWSYHRRAITYLKDELLNEDEVIPESLSDPNQLKDLAYLLIYASTQDPRENSLQKWSCAILKVAHVLVHLDNDLFTQFSSEIQEQILKPIQNHIHSDPVYGTVLGAHSSPDSIVLKNFVIKPFKRSDSSVTKLLAKQEVVAFTILDKMGVRFVTKQLFDVFRVMRYLVDNNIVSFPHNIPDQSTNTLYPANIFLEVMESFAHGKKYTTEEVDEALKKRLVEHQQRAEYQVKPNAFSSSEYHFLKFITRRLIRLEFGKAEKKQKISFFYPYEIQIIDYETHLKNLIGSASHAEYKKRQKRRARARVLGMKSAKKESEQHESERQS